MTQSIDTALITEFSDKVHVLAQQMKSRFRGKVLEEFVSGQDASIERLSAVEAIEITTRHAQTIGQDITHSRRRVRVRDFVATLYLDTYDEALSAIKREDYAQACARALIRQYDRVVAEAAFADVATGKQFGTTVTFANDGGSTVTTGSVGLTYSKLLSVSQNFINADVGTDMPEQVYLAITGAQHTDMMLEEELTSGDFRRDFVVEKGRITSAVGMEVIMFSGTASNPVLQKTSTTRDCIAFTTEGIKVGIAKEIGVTINQRPDLNNLWQVQARGFFGATRVEGARVQKVQCTES